MTLIALSLLHTIAAASSSLFPQHPTTFAGDVAFLKKYTPVVVLKKGDETLAVAPAWQGRVLTSALNSNDAGFGWLNYDFIATRKLVPHMNVFGGEDRIWLGPEGGQFSLFFKKGSPFDLRHWQTPPAVDTQPFRVVSKSRSAVTVEKSATLSNYSGTTFHVKMTRTVSLLSPTQSLGLLGISGVSGVKLVGYETKNQLTNMGRKPWTEKSGLLSIWILGQFIYSPTTTIVAPYRPEGSGNIVNDTYFGKVPSDRLKVGDNAIFFKGDGQYRSKIGLNPTRAKDVIGSYDPGKGVLTILKFSKPEGVTKYVNSMWEIQKHPFGGDAINSYNDGPPSPGAKPLGPFYEIESSSPAAALSPGQTITHYQRTFHIEGPKEALDEIAKKVFGVGLDDIQGAFGGPN